MRGRVIRRTLAVLAFLAAAVIAATPSPGEAARPPLRVLQLNLCHSGFAGCYSARAIDVAAAVMRGNRPDVVTLNEICADDVEALGTVLDSVFPGDTVVRAFRPAGDRRTGAPFACVNGKEYGIGLLARIAGGRRDTIVDGGLYPDDDTQDMNDPEQRAWVCVHVSGAYQACTTHLANTVPGVAFKQCRYLFGVAIPALHERAGYVPTVAAGDFNLLDRAQGCVPEPAYVRADDGAVQYVVATADHTVTSSAHLDLQQATDHPGLLVSLAPN
ncbi:endonuclease/exonuclease/phosphatase family protein [Dactylosporangium sp. NPDC051541]|uniref:endonuclease/exonuclease/phosphatase family protein n=1 Tax=Dactylosporangium sp. NPDC051541 TaxID=3363977 RepID=UPI003788B491